MVNAVKVVSISTLVIFADCTIAELSFRLESLVACGRPGWSCSEVLHSKQVYVTALAGKWYYIISGKFRPKVILMKHWSCGHISILGYFRTHPYTIFSFWRHLAVTKFGQ